MKKYLKMFIFNNCTICLGINRLLLIKGCIQLRLLLIIGLLDIIILFILILIVRKWWKFLI